MLTNSCGRFSNDLKLKYSGATKGVFLSKKKIMSKLAFYFYYLKAVTYNIEYVSLSRCLMSQPTFFFSYFRIYSWVEPELKQYRVDEVSFSRTQVSVPRE